MRSSQSSAQSLRIAIASSIPPRYESLLEDLHHDARVAVVAQEHLAGVVEVGVGVVALPHLLDGESKTSGGSRLVSLRVVSIGCKLELEAARERGLRDFELLR